MKDTKPPSAATAVNGLSLELHPETLALRRLSCGGRVWLANSREGVGLWQLHLADARGRIVDLDGAAAKTVATRMHGDTLRLDWRGVRDTTTGAGPFEVSVTIAPGAAGPNLTAWRLNVKNRSKDWTIWHARFPLLTGITVGEEPARDRLFYPDFWGRQTIGREAMAAVTGPCGGYGIHAMQFMGYGRAGHTLYMGAHDPAHWQKQMLFEPADAKAKRESPRMHFLIHPAGMTEAGNDLGMDYDIVVGEVAGDAFDIARVYAAFARQQPWACQPPPKAHQGPREAREVFVWEQASINAFPSDRVTTVNGEPAAAWVATMIALRRKLGVRLAVHMYHWHQAPFDTDYPDYFPVKRGFKKLVADLKKGGVVVMPYINGRLFDQAAPSYGPEAESAACKISAQRVNPKTRYAWPESYGNGQLLTGMCLHTDYWRQTVVNLCQRIVGELGCGGVYLDQLGCFGGGVCVDPRHGHPLGGGSYWLAGMRRLVADIREAVGPEPLLTTECNWEGCVADFDGLLDTKWNHDDNIPLFPAVYGGLGSIFGGDLFDGTYADGGRTFLQRTGMRFVWGGQLGWGHFEPLLKPANKALLDYVTTLCRLRAAYGRCFGRGEFLRPPEVRLADETRCTEPLKGPVLAGLWSDPDAPDAAVLFLVNVSDKTQTVQVRLSDVPWRCRAGSLERVRLPARAAKAVEVIREPSA